MFIKPLSPHNPLFKPKYFQEHEKTLLKLYQSKRQKPKHMATLFITISSIQVTLKYIIPFICPLVLKDA